MSEPTGTDRPLRMMFMSRHSMLDKTSGAALTIVELMRRARERGVATRIVTGTVFDVNPPREPTESDAGAWGPLAKESFGTHELWRVDYAGVENVLLRTQNTGGRRITDAETETLEALWEREVEDFKPDVVLMYCGFQPERRMVQRVRERGIPVVLHLANENYRNAAIFKEVDLIETTSAYLHDFYQKIDRVDPWVGAPVIDPKQVVAAKHEPRYITFINPAPAKGAGMFYQIAGLAAMQLPQAEFLVIESRGHAKGLWENQGLDLTALPNVTLWPHQQDMRKVYRKTRLLLFPSFWTECFGRVVVEAGWNGIPTLGARQGGIPEAMNGSGVLLDVPARCRQKYTSLPTPAEAQPWVDAIGRLLCDPDAYASAARRARAAAETFDPERVMTAILDRFNRLTPGYRVDTRTPGRDGAENQHTVIHLDGAADSLNVLHPAFREDGWRPIRLTAGTQGPENPPGDALNSFANGCARAIQADDIFRDASLDSGAAALQAMFRVLDDQGYAMLTLNEGEPFDRATLKEASDNAGFQQMAMTEPDPSRLRCILSKSRRSAQDWQAFRSLLEPPRSIAAAGG